MLWRVWRSKKNLYCPYFSLGRFSIKGKDLLTLETIEYINTVKFECSWITDKTLKEEVLPDFPHTIKMYFALSLLVCFLTASFEKGEAYFLCITDRMSLKLLFKLCCVHFKCNKSCTANSFNNIRLSSVSLYRISSTHQPKLFQDPQEENGI